MVDLQGRLSPVYNRFQPDFERMWTGREAVLRLGETVNTLALEQSRDKLRYGWFDARPRLGRQSRSRLKRGLGLN